MQFRTYINIKPATEQIDYTKSIFSLGSCFAENIAMRLQRAKFQVASSPTGILFNPESIADILHRLSHYTDAESAREQIAAEMRNAEGRWYNFHFHSAFCDIDREGAIDKMTEAHIAGAKALQSADIVIITFGTAWVYRLKENGDVVANCHKQPQSKFSKQLLSAEEIAKRYDALLSDGALAGKRVIFTVSPIRHLADGAEDNSLSKATLRVAIAEIVRNHSNAEYFPSFEIMNDELRDYRFYADDMVHPSPLAIDYIWQRFSEYAFSATTRQLIEQFARISQAAEHRPFNPTSEAHKRFCRQMLSQIEELNMAYPTLDFGKEMEAFCKYL
ncbi:MAG: GSCFA domain-containing protein [Alistipes sp.]|nr:GSCFA domain-containing protein [Alistipes sp.]